jgi:hypothetical protein
MKLTRGEGGSHGSGAHSRAAGARRVLSHRAQLMRVFDRLDPGLSRHMTRLALLSLALIPASVLPGRASSEVPHPLAYWVRAHVAVEGPASWSLTVRNGGYYTGHAGWLPGEFSGQLSPAQREELVRALTRLPREARQYSFGTPAMEGPTLNVLYEQPPPTTAYSVGSLTDSDWSDARLCAVAELAERLLRLIPPGKATPAMPWPEPFANQRRGRTSGCS